MATEAVKVPFVEAAAPSTPAASRVVVYAKADGLMYSKDDAGVETLMSGGAGGGSVATDAIWDAAGDLALGSGANTAAKLTKGADGTFLGVASGAVGYSKPVLEYVQNKLGGDVAITLADTFYDGPAVALSVGTWFLSGQVLGLTGGSGGVYELKLWDGTTVAANTKRSLTSTAQWVGPLPLVAIVVIAAGTPTWKISCASNTTGYSIKAAGDGNISGNVASVLTAIRLA